MKNLGLLIKPASGNCQLRCRYCFYKNVAASRDVASYGLMRPETLEKLVSRAIAETDESCAFSFQGGEPTLAGLDFYRLLIRFQEQYKEQYGKKRLIISNTLQTNGILLDAEWCDFFARHHFLIGLSLDGDKDLHDANRLDAQGKGTYSRVMQAADLLNKYKVDFNILCVVTRELARRAKRIYRALTEAGFRYLQFIPCIDDFGAITGAGSFSLTAGRYADFLKDLFDVWYLDWINGRYVSIRHFDNWIQMLKGRPPETCSMSGRCTCYGVVEADGGVYPCDFYVLDQWRLGSIEESSFADLLTADRAERFVRASAPVAGKCRNCRYYALCRGGCRRDREPLDPDGGTLNIYCRAYEQFFDHALIRMQQIARMID